MYDHWNLDALYTGYGDEKFVSDYKKLETLCEMTNALAKKAGKTDDLYFVREYLTLAEESEKTALKLFCFVQLNQAVNSKDEEAASYIGRIMSLISKSASSEAVMRKYIGGIENLDELTEKDELLSEYSYFLHTMKDDAAHLLSGGEEEILAKYDISGGSAWSNLRDYLTSFAEVEYDGGKTTLSDIRNKAYDESEEVRKSAYEAELSCYPKIKDSVAFALNSIKLQAINEAELRGFATPLDRTLYQSRMKKNTLDALLSAMEEYMPHFRRYLRAKAKLLGHEGGLPWYDLFAPVGKFDEEFTPESARAYLVKVFSSFDSELASMIDRAFAEEWIDFYPADGKQGGAFCEGIHPIRQSRILTNFGGKFTDVMTLAHELGHAFHNENIYSHRILNSSYSMPVAETASNFNEVLVMDYALSHASSDEEKLALLEGKLSDTTQIICDIYSRFLFEKSVFDARSNDFMFADRLSEMMLDAQKKAYGDGLDENVLHPYMWICKSHYYSSGLSYYNWPYAFGGLFAQGLFAKYKADGARFVPLYKKLLHATTVCSVEDTAKIAGIDLSDASFWKSGLDCFVKMIDEFEKLCEKFGS